MLSPGLATKIFIAVDAVDMRKGFEGLYGLVRDHLEQDPLSGHLFLFANRTKTRLKALVWDGSGLWVCAKRLEKGVFVGRRRNTREASRAARRVGDAAEWSRFEANEAAQVVSQKRVTKCWNRAADSINMGYSHGRG